jgi:hypothetical protein
LLLEGLSRNWGYYFTARTKPDDIGSCDIETVLEEMRDHQQLDPLSRQEDRDTTLFRNQDIAARRLLLPLYVRTLIFRIYLQVALEQSGELTDEHKKKWLILQIASESFFPQQDIFYEYVRRFANASGVFLAHSVSEESGKIQRIFGPEGVNIFCVFDEAQGPANMFYEYFLSSSLPPRSRPILRQVIDVWRKEFPCLIISGTGVSMLHMEDIIDSVSAKEKEKAGTMTNTGSFDTRERQTRYLENYLPANLLSGKSGNYLADRLYYWLHGRYEPPLPLNQC